MIFYNDQYVCNGCGLGHGCKDASKYIGYHENGYKIQNILAIMKMVTKFKRRVFIKKTCRIHEVIFKIKI